MRKFFVAALVAVSLLLAPAALAADDPTCNLPVRPHWCETP